MKLKFDAQLPFQNAAIQSVCGLFRGQELCRSEFTVTCNNPHSTQAALDFRHSERAIGNKLKLLDDELLSNLQNVQLQNGLRPSGSLVSGDFTVEMETGTGKTYVYLRTIFELNKNYGFTKFIIVVPSIAIKEGVYKTLQITEEHLRGLYANVPFSYFLYDSSKLGHVRNFATSPNIQIMVVTVGAINKKDVNNLYKVSEKTGGEKPIDLIKATSPIIIVDEPQSVDGGLSGAGKIALDAMTPLCTLRYSATHADKHHMIYRLDAVDAYEQKLVKQIEVASLEVKSAHNKPYVKLLSTSNQGGMFTAQVELDIQQATGVCRKKVTVKPGDDLEQVTGRGLYANSRVMSIGCKAGDEYLELSHVADLLRVGQSIGGVDDTTLKRMMIRRAIHEHLDKENRFKNQGIKILSLFFVDTVEHYRSYVDGRPVKGKYALIFEEEFKKAAGLSRFSNLFADADIDLDAQEVHNGYFSIDKKGTWKNTADRNQTDRDNAERAYNLIMKDKEKLLSFDSKLKFIFSHSALREGWDNPNVFQICTLREIGTERERRQTIGRGLRLCVNQEGERIQGFNVNTLTVIATESYEQFAENLQKEIEQDTGIRFGVVEKHQFAAMAGTDDHGNMLQLGLDQSESLWKHLNEAGYIDKQGKVQDSLRKALKHDTLTLPHEFAQQLPQVMQILKKLSGKLDIKNADKRKAIKTRQTVLNSEEFRALWDRIKHKTTYRVHFDNDKLIEDCTKALRDAPPIAKTRVQIRKADIPMGRGGVLARETSVHTPMTLEETDIVLPDVLTDLQDKTQLTRPSIAKILTQSGRLPDFLRNPQDFIDMAANVINRAKRLAIVDGIKYQRLGDEFFYARELFKDDELKGYLTNMLDAEKSVYEQVVYDSGAERKFAEDLEKNPAVKVYAKLPGWFKVPTPLGGYNPNWAVLLEDKNGDQRIYLVVETKGSTLVGDLRGIEEAKIACGKAHFEAIAMSENPARYIKAKTVGQVMSHLK